MLVTMAMVMIDGAANKMGSKRKALSILWNIPQGEESGSYFLGNNATFFP